MDRYMETKGRKVCEKRNAGTAMAVSELPHDTLKRYSAILEEGRVSCDRSKQSNVRDRMAHKNSHPHIGENEKVHGRKQRTWGGGVEDVTPGYPHGDLTHSLG